MADINIRISGPGLVVNGPAAIVHHILNQFGYVVQMEEFSGQYQLCDKDNWPDREVFWASLKVDDPDRNITVNIEVEPQPWGG